MGFSLALFRSSGSAFSAGSFSFHVLAILETIAPAELNPPTYTSKKTNTKIKIMSALKNFSTTQTEEKIISLKLRPRIWQETKKERYDL